MAKGLGKGLGALLGDFEAPAPRAGVQQVPIQRVEPNPEQPRSSFDDEALQALADSITAHGILQPLTVRELPGEYYQIIAGERRWRAARLAGLNEVPVLVVEADDRKAMELALIENLQREDLNPIEEARGYRVLLEEHGLSQEAISSRVGKSRPAVANSLRLLQLCPEVLALVESGALSAGHARAIVALDGAKAQQTAANKVLALRLSVRQTEALCKKLAQPPKEAPDAPEPAVDYYAECARDLSKALGRRAKIVSGRRKGRVELEYYGLDDLQRLLDTLLGGTE